MKPYLLVVEAEPAWGYSIRQPNYARRQPCYLLPPPSTLIGALAYPLALNNGEGEYYLHESKTIVSSPKKLIGPVLAASACYSPNSKAIMSEDINRYLILQFQRKPRRAEPKYRFGVVPAGKVYAPSAEMQLVYAIDGEKCSQTLGENWKDRLLSAAYSITRLGSREGILCVKKAELHEANEVNDKTINTRFYFPQDTADLSTINNYSGDYYIEEFPDPNIEDIWKWNNERNQLRTYIVPGRRAPIESSDIEVKVKHAFVVDKYGYSIAF
jgi:CRISPR-associated protein Cas5a/b/c